MASQNLSSAPSGLGCSFRLDPGLRFACPGLLSDATPWLKQIHAMAPAGSSRKGSFRRGAEEQSKTRHFSAASAPLRKLPQKGGKIHHSYTIYSVFLHLAARIAESFFSQ